MLTFPEETVLLLLDDEEGAFLFVGKSTLELALTGSVLMELAVANRIDTDSEQLMVVDRAPTDNPLIDRVLKRISDSEEAKSTKEWIEALSVEETAAIQEQALASLVERGILRREQRKLLPETVQHLWSFRSPRYFVVDLKTKREPEVRLVDVLFSDGIPDVRDVALLCLIDACGILPVLFREKEMERIASHVELIRNMDLIGREIASAIVAIERTKLQTMAHPLA